MVRSPWTLLWPRTGQTPAPGRPMWPPQHQAVDDLADRRDRVPVLGQAHRPAGDDRVGLHDHASRLADRLPCAGRWRRRPRPSRAPARWVAQARRSRRSCFDELVVDETAAADPPGVASAASRISRLIAWKRARSPLIRTWRKRSASSVPRPSMPDGRCGLRKRISPASGSGLIATIRAPRRLRLLERAQHARVVGAGVLADDQQQVGVRRCPRARPMPLPMPIVSVRAQPLDSWHMFEQSGRLLVPKLRANSW